MDLCAVVAGCLADLARCSLPLELAGLHPAFASAPAWPRASADETWPGGDDGGSIVDPPVCIGEARAVQSRATRRHRDGLGASISVSALMSAATRRKLTFHSVALSWASSATTARRLISITMLSRVRAAFTTCIDASGYNEKILYGGRAPQILSGLLLAPFSYSAGGCPGPCPAGQ